VRARVPLTSFVEWVHGFQDCASGSPGDLFRCDPEMIRQTASSPKRRMAPCRTSIPLPFVQVRVVFETSTLAQLAEKVDAAGKNTGPRMLRDRIAAERSAYRVRLPGGTPNEGDEAHPDRLNGRGCPGFSRAPSSSVSQTDS
jgi:hypothetical protein